MLESTMLFYPRGQFLTCFAIWMPQKAFASLSGHQLIFKWEGKRPNPTNDISAKVMGLSCKSVICLTGYDSNAIKGFDFPHIQLVFNWNG